VRQRLTRLPAILGLLALLLPAPPAAAGPNRIVLRTSISPTGRIWVGQRVLLRVDVLTPEGWAGIRSLPDFAVSGAQVVRYETQGTRLSDTISGTSYTGQRYQYSIFPRRGGTIVVPPVPVEVEVKTWGAGRDFTKTMKTPAVRFEVTVPPGAEGIRELVTTTGLRARQRWEPKPTSFKAGDAIKRTIVREAADVSAMAFDPIEFSAEGGVSVYPEQPSLHDAFDRGELRGRRIDSATFVFTGAGKVVLPDVVVRWWNPATRRLRVVTLKGLTLEVAAAPAGGEEEAPAEIEHAARTAPDWLLPALLLALLGAVLLLLLARPIASRLGTWRAERRESEAAHFRRFARSARAGNAAETARSLARWLDRTGERTGPARLDRFLAAYGDRETAAEADRLWRAVAAGGAWDGRALLHGLRAARRRWKRHQRDVRAVQGILPPLNP